MTLATAASKAGLPDRFTFHDLRHTFAREMLQGGVPSNRVQAWLVHATAAETLDMYGSWVPSMSDDGREAMNRILGAV